MKTILTLILSVFLIGSSVHSQLTNAEVYDFEVGDVFHTYFQHSTNSGGQTGTNHWDTIINKYYSTNSDTLFYQIKRHTKSYAGGGGTGISYPFTDTIITNFHANLSSIAEHYVPLNCLSCPVTNIYDTLGWCNSSTDIQSSYLGPNPFEPNIWTSNLQKGLGGPYYSRIDFTQIGNGAPSWNYYLLFSNTAQYGECGSPYSYSSIEEKETIKWTISPNPAELSLEIRTDISNYDYRILNMKGEIVHSGHSINNEKISIEFLEKGIYYIEIQTASHSARRRFIKI